eukprot:g35082.t1
MTREFEILVKNKKEAHVKYREQGLSESLEEYKGRSILKREIKRAKRKHEIALANRVKKNPKEFYKHIKAKRITRERIQLLKDLQGHLHVVLQEMDEILNEYLTSVFTVEKDMKARKPGEMNSDILKSVHIRKEQLLDVLKHTNMDKSPGPDQLYPRTLWEAREVIAGPLAEIFVSSRATDEVPEDWRLANVVLTWNALPERVVESASL